MLIGVITPAFNVAAYIRTALSSVIAQSHQDWAMLVVDDGSTDGTAEIVAGFADPRIRLLRQVNAGVSAARNRGIAQSHCDAVLFLDADDWLAPDALARLARCLAGEPAGTVAAYGAYAFVPEDATASTRPTQVKSGPFPSGDIVEPLLERNLFANGGHLLIRASAITEAGGFLERIAYGEDWEYWVRLALRGRFGVVPGAAPLLYARQRRGSAYLRMATEPTSFAACMNAIFGNETLVARFGPARCAALRRRSEAENCWIIGREMIRHGRRTEGRHWLARSVAGKPSPRRLALLAAAHLLPLLPPRRRGPFRPYSAG